MQLRRPAAACVSVGLAMAATATAKYARAQVVTVDTTHSLYLEAPTDSHMTIYTPGVDAQATPWEWLQVRAGWEADVVSGASVAVKAGGAYQANHPGADVVTSASVRDLRNQAHGGFTLKSERVALTAGYAYSIENDYRSNSFNVAARTDLFQHDTQLEVAYARNFDQVCDRVQSATEPTTRAVALEDHSGCFTANPLRVTLPIDIDGYQGSWTQAWTSVFTTQLVYTGQILSGFQSNPYRSVVLGEGVKAQEHVPDNRAREALAVRANYFFRPLRAALHVGVRGYADTWGITAGDVELELEKYIGDSFRVSVRGRVYAQTGAIFWSDDYTGGEGPKGQYWTGDRDLSPFTSFLGGLRAVYAASPTRGRWLAVLSGVRLGATADVIQFDYSDFTLGGVPLANSRAWIFGLNGALLF